MFVDDYSSYSVVVRANSAYPFDEEVSRFARTVMSIGSTRYIDDNLILRFNITPTYSDFWMVISAQVSECLIDSER